MLVLPLTAAIALVFSLLTMWHSEALTEKVEIVGSFFALEKVYNEGIAFGINIPSPWQEILIGGALVLVLLLAYRDREAPRREFGYGLIVGGALGNIVDRAIDGRVTDIFILGPIPTFNFADAAITIGVGLLLLDLFLDN